MRRSLVLASAFLLVAAAAVGARGAAPVPASATFVVTGHGWGHGVGLSQWGAYGYAQKGFDYAKIVLHYFPGTQIGAAPVSRVRVLLTSGVKTLTIGSTQDFRVRDATGAVHDVLAGRYTLTTALKLKVDDSTTAHALPGPLLFQPGTAPLALKNPYRGSLQVDVANGNLRAINVIGLEQYLYGVVPAEMPYTWSPEALKAQAVVARSYALAKRRTGAFDLYPDTRSQMYLGLDHERPSTNAAVNATAGKVVLYGGQVAKTYFFSTSGGRTASAQDAWGESVPYLVSVPDPYDSISPHHDWGPYTFTGATLAKRLKLPGRVLDLQPQLNSSQRIKALTVITTKGTVSVPGNDLRTRIGLRSTWVSVGVLSLSGPPQAVLYGQRARLSGVARGLGSAVVQEWKGSAWQPLGALAASTSGSVSVVVRPTATTQYRLATGRIAAAPVRVPVASLVRFYPTRMQDELRGYVRPAALGGARLAIQRQQGSGWATVAGATVDTAGNFVARLQLAGGVYRARVSPGRGFVAGTSPVLRVSTP